MCGIAGEITFGGSPISDRWVLGACQTLAHRGPDGEGGFADDGVAFGHRRLSIIDLEGGSQPMSYANGRYWITFNGEIYNYRELRTELEITGCEFHTQSDTEVILAAYAAWGVDSIERLDGIFAYGLWDAGARSLLLARDHLGIKPLLYHCDHDGLQFASELKPLLAHPSVGGEVSPEALHDYLALGYVLTPRTILKDVLKLPPGHYLLARDGQVTLRAYWDLAQYAQAPPRDDLSEREHVARFDALLGQTVKQQMVSDVPVGAFSSGGIDSSTIVHYAQANTPHALKTFSIGFKEEGYSELSFAQVFADHTGTDHYQHVQRPMSLDGLADLVWYYDEPLGDTSLIPTYAVSALARPQVKVALSGDGGDELLAGYDTYVADQAQSFYARLPEWVHGRVVQPLTASIPMTYRKVSLDYKLRKFIAHAHSTPERAHFGWRVMFDDDERRALVGHEDAGDYLPYETYAAHYEAVERASPLNRALYVDMKTWLVDDILAKVDRASMAVGLEVRVPFLGPRLVEHAMRLPTRYKLRGLRTKYILKKVMRDRLPRRIVNRLKSGFNAPIAVWMRDTLRADVDALFRARASTLVDLGHPNLQRIWHEHSTGEASHGYRLWALLSLLLWEQRVL